MAKDTHRLEIQRMGTTYQEKKTTTSCILWQLIKLVCPKLAREGRPLMLNKGNNYQKVITANKLQLPISFKKKKKWTEKVSPNLRRVEDFVPQIHLGWGKPNWKSEVKLQHKVGTTATYKMWSNRNKTHILNSHGKLLKLTTFQATIQVLPNAKESK